MFGWGKMEREIERKGMKLAGKRILEHRRKWLKTPKSERVSRQVRRRIALLERKREESAKRQLQVLRRVKRRPAADAV